MKVVGIIAEYNPFHLGHEYQIRYAKEVLGADFVVIAMSGNFVQRGTPALLEKHVRTQMALSGGADLVLELPVMWATASAEAFARGGVELLHGLCIVDELCFGCECGASEDFLFTAGILAEEPALYRETLRTTLKKGIAYPEARAHAFRAYLDGHVLSCERKNTLCDLLNSPNNILGIEYCKALLRLSSSIRPNPLLRKGSSYHKEGLSVFELPSAKALRQRILTRTNSAIPGSYEHPEKSAPNQASAQSDTHARKDPDLHFWMSKDAEKLLTESLNAHRCLSESCLDAPLLYAVLSAIHRGNLQAYQDMTPELANRIQKTISQYQSFSQYVSLLKTREITQTHLQRALIHVYLGLKELPEIVPYARILGFRKESGELLSRIRKQSSLPLISKPADAKQILNEAAYSVFETDIFCSNLYESLLLSARPIPSRRFTHELQKQIVVL